MLAGVIDPELGSDIVDLGMLREVTVGADGLVEVEVALTVSGCPLRTQLRSDIDNRVRASPAYARSGCAFARWTRLKEVR